MERAGALAQALRSAGCGREHSRQTQHRQYPHQGPPLRGRVKKGDAAQAIGTGPTMRYSAMPEMFQQVLTQREIRDLVAYLAGLKK